MKHLAAPQFWEAFNALDREAQEAARNAFELMNHNPRHQGVRLKKASRFWSARAGRGHRAIAIEVQAGLLWVWIGQHDPYDRKLG